MKALATRNETISPHASDRTRRRKTGNSPTGKCDDFTPRAPAIAANRLIESEEFEWTTTLNLPGLLVAGREATAPVPARAASRRPAMEDVFETEDGDAVFAVQLPGGLCAALSAPLAEIADTPSRSELSGDDEYVEARAKQLPGQLVPPAEPGDDLPTSHALRGLCATCALRDACEFPKPPGGVWRCEEYV